LAGILHHWKGGVQKLEVLMKRFLSVGFAVSLVPAMAGAAAPAKYRIDLRHGGTVYSKDLPVQRGTVVVFHQSPGGALTGLPQEEVLAIQSGSAKGAARTQVTVQTDSRTTVRTQAADAVVRRRASAIQILARPLEPGEILVLGPTGSGSAQVAGSNGYGAAGAMNNGGGAANGMNMGYANGANGTTATGVVPPGFAANGQPFVPAPGDLARAPSGNPPTIGPDGFPTNANPTTVMTGPNGIPVVAGSNQTAQPGSNQPIGPNGFPAPGTTTVQPGANQPIGPNGFPAPGTTTVQPGANQPVGPNGFPAPAGTAPSGTAPSGANPSGANPSGAKPSGNAQSGTNASTSGHP
jgi:hypothetical protein